MDDKQPHTQRASSSGWKNRTMDTSGKSVGHVTAHLNAEEDGSPIVMRATYPLFMVLVTLLALTITAAYYLLPLPATADQVLYIVDNLVALVLLFDFFVHLFAARQRGRRAIWRAWFNILGALPGLPALRLARIPSLILMLRELQDTTPLKARQRRAAASGRKHAADRGVGGVACRDRRQRPDRDGRGAGGDRNIKSGEDAVWWSIVTVATVGYGDRFPVTAMGRLIGAAMIVMGVSLFSVLTSYIATQFMARRKTAGPSETICCASR